MPQYRLAQTMPALGVVGAAWVSVLSVGSAGLEAYRQFIDPPSGQHAGTLTPFGYRSCSDMDGDGRMDVAVRFPLPADALDPADAAFERTCSEVLEAVPFGTQVRYD